MANFEPKRKSTNDFNNGAQLQNGDSVQAEFLNNVVESQLFTQGLATNDPDMSDADNFGKASAKIVTAPDGTAQLKFNNLKGNSIKSLALKKQQQVGNGVTKNTYELTFSDGTTQDLDIFADSGKNGIDITITEQKSEYAVSADGTTQPSAGWTTTIPSVAQGSWLWTRTTVTYSDGNSTVAYSKAYIGVDGKKGEPMYAHYVSIFYSNLNIEVQTLLFSSNATAIYDFAGLRQMIVDMVGNNYVVATGEYNGYPVSGLQASNYYVNVRYGEKQVAEISGIPSIRDNIFPISQKGEQGVGISSVEALESRVEGNYTVTPLQVNFDDDTKTPETIEVAAINGKDSHPIIDITSGSPIITDDKTTTPVTVRTTDNTFAFSVTAENGTIGKDGATITSITVTKVS